MPGRPGTASFAQPGDLEGGGPVGGEELGPRNPAVTHRPDGAAAEVDLPIHPGATPEVATDDEDSLSAVSEFLNLGPIALPRGKPVEPALSQSANPRTSFLGQRMEDAHEVIGEEMRDRGDPDLNRSLVSSDLEQLDEIDIRPGLKLPDDLDGLLGHGAIGRQARP